jgi:periplasmic divalent cation tolerance protein
MDEAQGVVANAGGVVLVWVTAPDLAVARTIAEAVVDARLAACVNILTGVHSVYRWQGAVCVEPEAQMLIKTTSARVSALEACVRRLHPYALPEFLVTPVVAGRAPYLRWVEDSVAAAIDPATDAE